MTNHKKRWLTALAVSTAAAISLTGCITGGSAPTGSEDADGPLVIQSFYTDTQKDALTALVDAFEKKSGQEVTVNTINAETFRSQLPTYLTSANPPDVYTYFAGSATQGYASEGLLLDLSSVWEKDLANYSESLKSLSTTDGKQYFIPLNYYWWSVYYKPSVFEKYGVEVPSTWEEFLSVNASIKEQGGTPIAIGLSDSSWLLAAWFDYLDVRINGGQYHLDLLAGKHKFTDPEVVAVMDALGEVLPYFDPDALGETMSSSTTKWIQGEAAMYLSGSFIQSSVPESDLDDIAFFKFPTVDQSVPDVEEAPTDGLIISAGSTHQKAAREFAAFAASAAGQESLIKGMGSTTLATSPDAKLDLDALAQQGKEQLDSATQLTQFYNRDASDELLTPATTALTKFFSDQSQRDAILAEWQTAVDKARQ